MDKHKVSCDFEENGQQSLPFVTWDLMGKTGEFLKELSQKDFRERFEGWKARTERRVASKWNYSEGVNVHTVIQLTKLCACACVSVCVCGGQRWMMTEPASYQSTKIISLPHLNSVFWEIDTCNEQQYPMPPPTRIWQLSNGTYTGFRRVSCTATEHG
jgi:hypothetical protein